MKLVPSIHPFGEVCRELLKFPNATVAEYGTIKLQEEDKSAMNVMRKVQAEVFARGPVVASINGGALHSYRGGIINDTTSSKNVTHAVSIVGWDVDANDGSTHYIVRNSWGEYFGGMLPKPLPFCR
jgi:C1A family cysteine protease